MKSTYIVRFNLNYFTSESLISLAIQYIDYSFFSDMVKKIDCFEFKDAINYDLFLEQSFNTNVNSYCFTISV